MVNRAVFTLTAVMAVLFFLASHYDNYFFLLHFLETAIYLTVLLLLFYGIEEWAYSMAFLAPLLWIVLAILGGTLQGGLAALGEVVRMQPVDSPARLVNGLLFVTGVVLSLMSGRVLWKEIRGRPGALWAFIGSFLVTGAFYSIVIFTLLRMVQPTD